MLLRRPHERSSPEVSADASADLPDATDPPNATDGPEVVEPGDDARWRERISKLRFWLIALAAAFAAVPPLLDQAQLTTPIQSWVVYLGLTVAGLSALFTLLLDKAGSMLKEHPRFVFCVIVSVNAIYLGIAVLAVVTHDPRLQEGRAREFVVPAGGREVVPFHVDPGAHVVLRVSARSDATLLARAHNGERDEVVDELEAGSWGLDSVMVGGDWRLSIMNGGNEDLTVEVLYEVSAPAADLVPGRVRTEFLPEPTTQNGYVIRADEDGMVRLLIDGFSPGDLQLSIVAFRGSRRVGLVVERDGGGYEKVLPLDAGHEYVLAIRALDGATGSYRIAYPHLAAEDPDVPGEPLDPDDPNGGVSPILPPLPPAAGTVRVPEVYGLTEGEAFGVLRDAGLNHVEAIRVCSDSVDEGLVRQAFVLDGSAEVVVADRPGAARATDRVGAYETIRLKISTGQPCG